MLKRSLLISFMLLFAAVSGFAAKGDNLTVESGKSKTSAQGRITVKFISVVDDSRCPEGTQCIWAGNAKVRIMLFKGKKGGKVFELNSGIEPRTIAFEGYDIMFVSLTSKQASSRAALTVSVTKHK